MMIDQMSLMKLLYDTLPASDLASVPEEVLLSYVRHALFLRKNSPFCKDLPLDSFLHYVFYPRINSEDLCDCRRFFYDQLAPRIEGLSEREAVLEINRWCAENMTYESSDARTENPMTAYNCGLGRCGEESTFAVTAFRSVGIPARQIYVPWWVHCDDNHAWVEVYVDGQWNFLGACEPEPVLNLGWFNDASSRAPLACCRSFMDYVGEGLKDEEILERSGCSVLYNVTHHYTPVTRLSILVQKADGSPLPQARVRLELVNTAALRPIFTGVTGDDGVCSVSIGRTNFHLEVCPPLQSDNAFASESASILPVMQEITVEGESQQILVTLTDSDLKKDEIITQTADYIPAPVTPYNKVTLTPEQNALKRQTLQNCNRKRIERIASYYIAAYDELDPEWQEILHLAGKHAAKLYQLYCSCQDTAHQELLKSLLQAMTVKDYRDVDPELLEQTLALDLEMNSPADIRDLINPRILYEPLSDYRTAIRNYFTQEQMQEFARDPQSFMDYINVHFTNGGLRYYPVLSVTPAATLRLGHSDKRGRSLLWVAAMRTMGIPARLNPADESPEYRIGDRYIPIRTCPARKEDAGEPVSAALLLPQTELNYGVHYSLSVWQQDHYQPLDYQDSDFEAAEAPASALRKLRIAPGRYRLLTTNRLPNGNQLCHSSYFRIRAGEKLFLPLILRQAKPAEMLSHYQLLPFRVTKIDQKLPIESSGILKGLSRLFWLDPGTEPTEHVLNELLAAADRVTRQLEAGGCYAFLLKEDADLTNPTLQKVCRRFPAISLYLDTNGEANQMAARKMFLEPGVYPLLLLTDEDHIGYYGSCGYQVGAVMQILSLNPASLPSS